jgi:hypothetical protein
VNTLVQKIALLDLPVPVAPSMYGQVCASSPTFSLIDEMSKEEDVIEEIFMVLIRKIASPIHVSVVSKTRDVIQILSSLVMYAYTTNETPQTVFDTLLEFPSHLTSAPKRRKEITSKLMIGNNSVNSADLATLDGDGWLNDKVHIFLPLISSF